MLKLYPDPASRFQPKGPHGPSQVVDPRKFKWTDEGWGGVNIAGQVIYEMHIGTFIQNHDQIANSGRGERCHLLTSPGHYRAITALLLLAPGTPLLFQGQEFASSNPFLYFADFEGELKRLVREGRKRSLAQFRSLAMAEMKRLCCASSEKTAPCLKLIVY